MPEGKFALSFVAGSPREAVKAPGTIEAAVLVGQVVFIDAMNELDFGDGTIRTAYEVNDPVTYFKTFGAGGEELVVKARVDAEVSKRAVSGNEPIDRQTLMDILAEVSPSITVHR